MRTWPDGIGTLVRTESRTAGYQTERGFSHTVDCPACWGGCKSVVAWIHFQ
jgi:hypothetical protein